MQRSDYEKNILSFSPYLQEEDLPRKRGRNGTCAEADSFLRSVDVQRLSGQGDLIDMAVSRDRDLTTDSVSETQFLLKTLINSATPKDTFFRERTKEDGSLIDCLDGDWELATEILSKFIVPVLNKMMNNLKYASTIFAAGGPEPNGV